MNPAAASPGALTAIIFGARGTLGQALAEVLPQRGYNVAAALGSADCDIADSAAVRAVIKRVQPVVVFNAAAFTDVDRAEDTPDRAFAVNALGPENLAKAASACGAALVHYSTDFVFDGERERLYDEFDPPSPQGLYARSKVAGESLAAAATAQLFTLRVGCLYGRGGRNFPSTILRRLQAGETVRADRDRRGSPTWVRQVAEVSAALARTSHHGLYHCTSQGETSWSDFARFIAERLKLPAERVVGLPTAALPMKAPRPRRAILDNRLLRLRGLDTMSTWQDAAMAFMASEGA
ncbi:MAG TPA: dTDP-4-dehydrorhamnose reductase [Polyangia bacterium]|jgi:dTDP-4-dehydrorhamnose reductase